MVRNRVPVATKNAGPAMKGGRMQNIEQKLAVKTVYARASKQGEGATLGLVDKTVHLNDAAALAYERVSESIRCGRSLGHLSEELGMSPEAATKLQDRFRRSGLLVDVNNEPETSSGVDFYDRHFEPALDAWLAQAFSHPFWDRMLTGKGSQRLYAGWLFELYHYTRNANRHMPLSCAHTINKNIKTLRAKHYVEEWNHYHYFAKALAAMGYSRDQVANSEPLPMTLAMSNFMREAARRDVLAYSICSAVLEGTTVGEQNFEGYYAKCVEHYGVPQAAVSPIYDHLALDQQYGHANLFRDILANVETLSAERASVILTYGHQLVEHIWLWTHEIESYYGKRDTPVPRPQFSSLMD